MRCELVDDCLEWNHHVLSLDSYDSQYIRQNGLDPEGSMAKSRSGGRYWSFRRMQLVSELKWQHSTSPRLHLHDQMHFD